MTISHFMQCFLVCLAMLLLLMLQLLPSLEWRKKKKLITWTFFSTFNLSCVFKKKQKNVPVLAPNILILPNLHPLLMKWHELSLIPTCVRQTPVNTSHLCHIRGVTENIRLNYIYLKLPLVNTRPTTASLLIHSTNKCVCLSCLECCSFYTAMLLCRTETDKVHSTESKFSIFFVYVPQAIVEHLKFFCPTKTSTTTNYRKKGCLLSRFCMINTSKLKIKSLPELSRLPVCLPAKSLNAPITVKKKTKSKTQSK